MTVSFEIKDKDADSITRIFGLKDEDVSKFIMEVSKDSSVHTADAFMNTVEEESGQIIASMACLFYISIMAEEGDKHEH